MGWANSIRRPCSLIVVLVAVFALAACGNSEQAPPAPSTESEPRDPSVEKFLDDTLPNGASGTVVAARDGSLAHCRGFGLADRDAKVAARCDTVYDTMSMTKQFTAAAILKLEMMGKLRVSDPLSKFVGPVPDDKRASILAAIIEQVSGRSYEEFLAENLFAPAGMTQTGYVLPEWKPDQVAVEYDENGVPKGKPFDHPWAEDGPYWNLRGNGGMLSTARDMFRWLVALRGDEVLSKSAKDKLFKPHVPEEESGDSYYGYGWVVSPTDEGRIVWHDGGNGWSLGIMARFPDQDAMVFWVSNHAYKDGEWNLENLERKLTLGIAERVLDDG